MAAATHDHYPLALGRREHHRRPHIASVPINQSRDRVERIGGGIPDAGVVTPVAKCGDAAVKEAAVRHEVKRGIRREEAGGRSLWSPRTSSGIPTGIEGLRVALENAVLVESADCDDLPVTAVDERRIPVTFIEVRNCRVGMGCNIESVRVIRPPVVEVGGCRRIRRGATGNEQAAVR